MYATTKAKPSKSLKVPNSEEKVKEKVATDGDKPAEKVATDGDKPAEKETVNSLSRKRDLIRKFSLGGDAWNKKSSSKRKVSSGVKSDIDTIDDEEEDEGRYVEVHTCYLKWGGVK